MGDPREICMFTCAVCRKLRTENHYHNGVCTVCDYSKTLKALREKTVSHPPKALGSQKSGYAPS